MEDNVSLGSFSHVLFLSLSLSLFFLFSSSLSGATDAIKGGGGTEDPLRHRFHRTRCYSQQRPCRGYRWLSSASTSPEDLSLRVMARLSPPLLVFFLPSTFFFWGGGGGVYFCVFLESRHVLSIGIRISCGRNRSCRKFRSGINGRRKREWFR